MHSDRRSFLKQFSGSAAALVAAAATEPMASPAAAQEVVVGGARPPKRNYLTANCLLELEGQVCGWLLFAEGGGATGEVIETRSAKDGLVKKQLGPLRYDDLILSCGAGLNAAVYEWMKTFFARQATRKSGAVVYLDRAGREVGRLSFTNALITEVGFPLFDVAWGEPAVMTLRLTPESTRRHRDNAGRGFNLDARTPLGWLASNFLLTVDGLAETTTHAIRVEPISARAPKPMTLESSDLVLTYPAAFGQALETWFEDFVGKSNNADAQEKSGILQLIAADQTTVFFSLSFDHLGIYRLEPVLLDTGNRVMPLLQARLYCENLQFDHYLAKV